MNEIWEHFFRPLSVAYYDGLNLAMALSGLHRYVLVLLYFTQSRSACVPSKTTSKPTRRTSKRSSASSATCAE